MGPKPSSLCSPELIHSCECSAMAWCKPRAPWGADGLQGRSQLPPTALPRSLPIAHQLLQQEALLLPWLDPALERRWLRHPRESPAAEPGRR